MTDYAGMLLDTDSPHVTERGGWTFTATLETDEMGEQVAYENGPADVVADLKSGDLTYVMVTVKASRSVSIGLPITLGYAASSPVEYRRAPQDHIAADLRAKILAAEVEATAEVEAEATAALRHLCATAPA